MRRGSWCMFLLVAEVPDAGEDHGHAEAIGGGDDVGILYGATGLDGGGNAMGSGGFEAVRKREERVGGKDAAFQREHALLCADFHREDTAHLTGAGGEQLAFAGVDDGVGLDVLDN